VEVGGISILLEYERRYVLQLWLIPQLQHVQICHTSNGFSSKEEWTVHFFTGDCTKHIDFRRVTLMIHIGMWVFISPYSDIATIYCTADVECRSSLICPFSRKWSSKIIKSCNGKQKSSRRLGSSSNNCCTISMRCGWNTKSLCRNIHTVVFDIDSSLAAVPVDLFDHAENWPEPVQRHL